jgi:hypothetical protein
MWYLLPGDTEETPEILDLNVTRPVFESDKPVMQVRNVTA